MCSVLQLRFGLRKVSRHGESNEVLCSQLRFGLCKVPELRHCFPSSHFFPFRRRVKMSRCWDFQDLQLFSCSFLFFVRMPLQRGKVRFRHACKKRRSCLRLGLRTFFFFLPNRFSFAIWFPLRLVSVRWHCPTWKDESSMSRALDFCGCGYGYGYGMVVM